MKPPCIICIMYWAGIICSVLGFPNRIAMHHICIVSRDTTLYFVPPGEKKVYHASTPVNRNSGLMHCILDPRQSIRLYRIWLGLTT